MKEKVWIAGKQIFFIGREDPLVIFCLDEDTSMAEEFEDWLSIPGNEETEEAYHTFTWPLPSGYAVIRRNAIAYVKDVRHEKGRLWEGNM